MSFGLDYVTGPPIASLKAASVTFVCRYLSEVNDLTRTKLLTPAEAKALSAAGISIVSNYEWYGNRAAEGFASGAADAQIAASQHEECGGPKDRPIYFSVDFDTDVTPAILDYFKGVASVIGLERTGAYGGYACIKGLLDADAITWAWQTYAWSGQWDARAHIQQYQNGLVMDGFSVDYDRAMKEDFGQWVQGGSMLLYTPQSADFGTWFTATDADHWLCKKTSKVIQFAHREFYAGLSLDGQSLPILGLPLTDEIYLSGNGKTVVLMVYERAAIFYDPDHVKDHQPGTGIFSLCHLTDPDFLKAAGLEVIGTSQPINLADARAQAQAMGSDLADASAKWATLMKDLGVSA